jgi:hypothetical protein
MKQILAETAVEDKAILEQQFTGAQVFQFCKQILFSLQPPHD